MKNQNEKTIEYTDEELLKKSFEMFKRLPVEKQKEVLRRIKEMLKQ